jgi:hypothetical protein
MPSDFPQPTFPYRAHGIALSSFGEEGGYIASGHIEGRRFIAACNHHARIEFGVRNMTDDRDVTAADVLAGIRRRWAVPAAPEGYEWALEWADEGADGAIPVTVWEPW